MPVNKSKKHKPATKRKDLTEFKVYVETTLLDFLLFKYSKNLSRNAIKHLLSNHRVAVNGVPVTKFDYPLRKEDEVIVSKMAIAPKSTPKVKVLFENEKLIAIDKPAKLLSVASDKEKGKTAFRLASAYVSAKDPKARLYVVHRLDEDTSGVLLFSKDYEYKEKLQHHWQDIVRKRGYYAIVEGEDIAPSGELRNYLMEDKNNLMYVGHDKTKGKLAITKWKKIASSNGYSLLDVNIDSGRKNQIRVQLGYIGHHVIGDDKYGEPSNPLGRLGLHAYCLEFVEPDSKKTIRILSQMPKAFQNMFAKKGKQL